MQKIRFYGERFAGYAQMFDFTVEVPSGDAVEIQNSKELQNRYVMLKYPATTEIRYINCDFVY